MTHNEALQELHEIARYLSVSKKTLKLNPDMPCEWTWHEQDEVSKRLLRVYRVLEAKS